LKNSSSIAILFVANFISGIAQGISMLAIPWYFVQQGKMGLFGVIYIIANAIALAWVPYAGTLIDRYNRKNIFLIISLVCGMILMSISLFGFLHGYLPWWLVAAAFMLTFFNYNIHYPNIYAFVQEITEPEHYGRITSLLEVQGQLSTMLAGAGAAILLVGTHNGMLNIFGLLVKVPFDIPSWTIYEIFALDAVTYFIGFIIIAFIRYTPLQERIPEIGTLFSRLNIGLNYLKENPYILVFGIASYAVFVTIMVEGFYLNAMYVNDRLFEGGDVFAASEMYYAFGAIFAGITIQRLFTRLLYLSDSVVIFYLVSILLGLSNAGTRIMRVTYLFRTVPNQVYGRANSVFSISNILLRIGFLTLFTLPFFHQANHVVYAFAIMSIFLLVAAVVLILHYRKFVGYYKT
jgi:MFS family permease